MISGTVEVEKLTRRFKVRVNDDAKRGWFSKKIYKELDAVAQLSFSIDQGEKVAFIGPNGAGKSTTLKMLSGLLMPCEGTARVCGLVPWDQTRELARHIGLVFGQKSHLWMNLPVQDSFDLLARIYDLDEQAYRRQLSRLIELFSLSEFLGQYAKNLSLGQRMRCDIAAALLHKPQVLFLDEPTIGLDVTAKSLLRDHLNKLADQFDTTILLTSHDTEDIEKICQRVILIDHGQKLIDTSLMELQRRYAQSKILRLATEEKEPDYDHPHVVVEQQGDHMLVLKVDVTQVPIEVVVADCLNRFKLHDIGIEGLPLDEIIKMLYEQRVCYL
ncbi:MAG: ATP-binding cassette domain-containing protein [Proteobacteria bacterium]|jgi:ABC-2 type transport system ATP-binding protein|nr:ATP-binding cassette domain-containing protein [Alphaproteobacteria bacterium]NCC02493.1 ATP-binding cassette domain-containing protein [Pseudomonadota bacterium]